MKKIMFNDKYGLTQAVLEGRKTQTRRVVVFLSKTYEKAWRDRISTQESTFKNCLLKYSTYKVGEVVAVAQAYKNIELKLPVPIAENEFEQKQSYHIYGDTIGWHNKMFVKAELMPHSIKITNIRIERLQDISKEDCLKEGVKRKNERYVVENQKGVVFYTNDPILAFRCLIDKTCGKGTWDSNPYVFVYDFELVK